MRLVGQLLRSRLPWSLLAAHAAIVVLYSPIVVATVNTETAPLGLLPLLLVDYPILAWLPEGVQFPWPLFSGGEVQRPVAIWAYAVCPLILGSIMWFAIGLLLALPMAIGKRMAERREPKT